MNPLGSYPFGTPQTSLGSLNGYGGAPSSIQQTRSSFAIQELLGLGQSQQQQSLHSAIPHSQAAVSLDNNFLPYTLNFQSYSNASMPQCTPPSSSDLDPVGVPPPPYPSAWRNPGGMGNSYQRMAGDLVSGGAIMMASAYDQDKSSPHNGRSL